MDNTGAGADADEFGTLSGVATGPERLVGAERQLPVQERGAVVAEEERRSGGDSGTESRMAADRGICEPACEKLRGSCRTRARELSQVSRGITDAESRT